MSVSLTEPQVRARSKTVTRRDGWEFVKPGDLLTLCPRTMGFKRGEHVERICTVEVVSVRRERLDAITLADVAAEGFLGWTVPQFIRMFTGSHKGTTAASVVTRIEWRYLEESNA